MLKGLLDIKVYDKNGKLKQHETGENIITDLTSDLLKTIFGDINIRMLGFRSNPIFLSDIQENFNGILMFNNLLIEDKKNYFEQLINCNVVGHADSLQLESDAVKYGIINSSASSIDNNSITKVWNFGQGKAVGTINSVALCSNSLGRFGLDDDAFAQDNNAPFIYNDRYKWDGNQSLKITGFNTYSPTPHANDSSNKIYFAHYRNGVIYAYTTSLLDYTRTINIYKITLDKFYKKTNFGNYMTNDSTWGGSIVRVYSDNVEPDATITAPGTHNFFACTVYKNIIYFIGEYMNSRGRVLYKYDMDTNEFSYVKNDEFTGTANEFYSFAVNDKGVFFINATDNKIARYTENLVYVNDIDIDSRMISTGNNWRIYNYTEDGLIFLVNLRLYRACITDLVNYRFIQPEYSRIFANKEFNYNFVTTGIDTEQVTLQRVNSGISTIKNLSNPVVKGESDEMVVTYKVIKTEG